MFPGLGGLNPAQMQRLMKQMGIETKQIDAKKIIIELDDKKLVFLDPDITKMVIQGQETYQIIPKQVEILNNIDEESVKIVMEKANVDEEKAKEALEHTKGDIAEAILYLKEK